MEHVSVGSNSEEDSDRFFIEFMGLNKIRSKVVSADLMDKFFGVNRENKYIIYGDGDLLFEVFITNDNSKAQDVFTHCCVLIENRDELINKATSMGFDIVKVPRNDGNGYYLFVQDLFQNLYEIKEK
jgi:hypothetical protein